MTTTTSRLRGEGGSAIVTALLVTSLFLIAGITVLGTVDVQQGETRRERNRESSFQLAEGVLNTQIYRLSQQWPGQADGAFPATCTAGSATPQCPSSQALRAGFKNVDYGTWTDTRWTTQVRDNGPGAERYYSDAVAAAQSAYDANGDNKLWVRAQAVVRGRPRTLVALVKAENLSSRFTPNKTLVAGYFATTNSGNKVIINNGASGEVWVRCQNLPSRVGRCADYDAGKGQVSPARIYQDPNYPRGMTVESLDSVRAQAQAQGNYYQGCAPSLQGDKPGEVVFMEDAVNCRYNGNDDYNTRAAPGAVVIAQGTIQVLGNATFHGIIYHANVTDSNAILVDLGGNNQIVGGIVIDGPGGVFAGSSKENLVHDPNAGNALKTFGTVGIVQNSFREITATG